MVMLKAGVARKVLKPRVGADLVGYFAEQLTTGIHDDIHARALILDDGETRIALCSVESCIIPAPLVQLVRQTVSAQCDLAPDHIHVFTTHTHSAPGLHVPDDWTESPINTLSETILEAHRSRQPARFGAGFGQLQGYSINRRWLNRPVDPAVGVLRIDTEDGTPLAILGNYGNHAVVLGYDNRLISGDWPGYSSRRLERQFGGQFVALFSQGGAGDVNPLTETVRQKLAAGHPVKSIGGITTLYGVHGESHPDLWDIGDRAGGTFTEAETIALAYNAEVMRVWEAIPTSASIDLWTTSLAVNGAPGADEPPIATPPDLLERLKLVSPDITEQSLPLEVALIGIGDCVLVGQPGESFAETAVDYRKTCQQMGYAYPLLVSYMNGWYAYLVPENAYAEGGYEVAAARSMGLSRYVQDRMRDAAIPVLRTHVPV